MSHPIAPRPSFVVAAIGLCLCACTKLPLDEHLQPLAGPDGPATVSPPDRAAAASIDDEDAGPMGNGPGPWPSERDDEGDGIVPGAGGADGGPPSRPPVFSKPALLAATAACVVTQLADFERDALALSNATASYQQRVDEGTRLTAQAAWRAAMRAWQRLEPMRVGPAAPISEPGGRGLRDQIYSYPLASACRVDQQLVGRIYAQPGFSDSLVSARGLSAIEYLLFHTGPGNACAGGLDINASGAWAALSEGELAQRRADYAAVAAADVHERARLLRQAWQASDGDFADVFARPAQAGSPYESEARALNALTDALFYLEKEVKDYKLGWPLGYVDDCVHAPGACPDAVESRYAQVSTDHIRQNLIGFRRIFEGCGASYQGLGIDDWLKDEGQDDLVERMRSALDHAQHTVEALDPPLEEAARLSPPVALAALHAAIKAITDPLKTELVSALLVDLPATAEGDND